jgi:copper chaperone NosL
MTIADDHYGAEIVTDKGRVHKYDSIECMVNALIDDDDADEFGAAGLYTTDFVNRGSLVDATTAVYLRSRTLPSPMGMSLTSFARAADAESVRTAHEGDILDWGAVKRLVLAHANADSAGHSF